MLRRHHRFFQTSQLLRDTLLVALAFVWAFRLRASVLPAYAALHLPPLAAAAPKDSGFVAFTLMLMWPWMGWLSGLYVSRRTKRPLREAIDVARALALTLLGAVTLTYFTREVRYSRGTLMAWAALSFVLLVSARLAQKWLLGRLRRAGRNLRHVLVVGEGPLTAQVVRTIAQEPSLGLQVVGVLSAHGAGPLEAPSVPALGPLSRLPEVLEAHTIDQVIIALPIAALGQLPALMQELSRHTVDVRLVPDLYEVMTLCGSIEDFFGLPMIDLQATPMVGLHRLGKRVFDLLFAMVASVLLAPVFATIALLVALEGRGPVLYRQRRVGLDGRPFNMYKFRTMRADAEAQGARMTLSDDPRRTALGRVLRRFSLDELPQLFNVLRGDMSLVGPRPEQPSFCAAFVADIPRYALRHKIKAGMTGWAQINGLRGNTSIAKRIELDLYYIENWSLALDFKILVRTVLGGFISPHAY
jgi:Undecaprenyl-phosphate glucose phosphotransferase